jgi:serine/threonine protein kinase
VRFAGFELDLCAGELRDSVGKTTRLPEQPFCILALLIERPGEVLSRDAIRRALWPNDTIVEFEHSITAAMNRLRMALGDSADSPHYIETLARRGYRWMVAVEWLEEYPMDGTSAAAQEGPQPRVYFGSNAIGKKVSHYRVLEILGGGGMGVVYEAEDLKLGRRVAVKFLAEELGNDARSLERFRREARAAATLNHPNICTIHEFGEHEGQPFLVMELLEGRTLREYLESSSLGDQNLQASANLNVATTGLAALSLNALLDIGIQITAGLDAAAQRGIIHRDIKPANIFITNRGQAKILDFGLAKLAPTAAVGLYGIPEQSTMREAHTMDGSTTVAPGADFHLSLTGEAMGTAAYMSPEQVRGEALDGRTDLFSFGLVLYEIATRRPAFSGATAALVHDAVLNRAPARALDLNPNLPPKLDEIINKALEKDPGNRYQSASEMRADLEVLKQDLDAAPPSATRSRQRFYAIAAGLVALTGISVWMITSSTTPRVRRTLNLTHSGTALGPGRPVTDGSRLYFIEREGGHYALAQVPIGGGVPVIIPTPFPSTFLYDISPDHSQLLVGSFQDGESETPLWTLPTSGGSPHRLGNMNAGGAAWSPDGRRIICTRGSELYLLDANGSESHKLVSVPGQTWGPRWSPDGHWLRFTLQDPKLTTLSLWEVSSEGANLHRLLLPGWKEARTQYGDGESGGDWTPDGKYFVFQSSHGEVSSIWAVREKPHFLHQRQSAPQLLATSEWHIWQVSLGENGRKVFFAGANESLELARFDSRLNQFVPNLSGIAARYISFSRDRQWVAYVTVPGYVLWRSRLDGSDRLQLTFPPISAGDPEWSPDGQQIAFCGVLDGRPPGIFLVPRNGGTPQSIIAEDWNHALRPDWSARGDFLLFTRLSPATSGQVERVGIYQVDLTTRQQALFRGAEGLRDPARSPDGRFVAALGAHFTRLMLFDSRSERWVEVARGAGLFGLAWSGDSKYVYSQSLYESNQPIFRVGVGNHSVERIATLKQLLRSDITTYKFLGIAPDGSPLATLTRKNSDIHALDVDFP